MKAVVISSLVSSLLGLSGANLFAYKNIRAKKDGGHHDHPVNIVEQMLDAAGATPRKESAASTHFYDAAVKDHYTTSIATQKEPKWSQRYYVDTSFWKGEGSPVFLYIGGEGPQSAPSSRLFMWTAVKIQLYLKFSWCALSPFSLKKKKNHQPALFSLSRPPLFGPFFMFFLVLFLCFSSLFLYVYFSCTCTFPILFFALIQRKGEEKEKKSEEKPGKRKAPLSAKSGSYAAQLRSESRSAFSRFR